MCVFVCVWQQLIKKKPWVCREDIVGSLEGGKGGRNDVIKLQSQKIKLKNMAIQF